MSAIITQPIKVRIDGGVDDGLLILHDSALVAILVCLEAPFYDIDRNRWHLEAGFGPCARQPRTFERLEEALRWVARRLGLGEEAIRAALDGSGPVS